MNLLARMLFDLALICLIVFLCLWMQKPLRCGHFYYLLLIALLSATAGFVLAPGKQDEPEEES